MQNVFGVNVHDVEKSRIKEETRGKRKPSNQAKNKHNKYVNEKNKKLNDKKVKHIRIDIRALDNSETDGEEEFSRQDFKIYIQQNNVSNNVNITENRGKKPLLEKLSKAKRNGKTTQNSMKQLPELENKKTRNNKQLQT
jgi:hypothetical protein